MPCVDQATGGNENGIVDDWLVTALSFMLCVTNKQTSKRHKKMEHLLETRVRMSLCGSFVTFVISPNCRVR